MDNYRNFTAGPDPFGRTWKVEFQWLQTAISIRHSDSVDVKYIIATEGESKQEKVVALPHPDLLAVCKQVDHPLSDPFCMKLAGLHLSRMIESFEDMDKTLVTVTKPELLHYAQVLTEKPQFITR
jgi:hypothetical protein